ncbi:MAG TPA: hypothetical protein VKB19_20035, partial [Pedobacter sp.]|nr:hypothetical protein [Pedobacter sp.]
YKYKYEQTTVTPNGSSSQGAEEDQAISFGNSEESNLKRSDFGINLLTGFQFNNGLGLQIGYGLGLYNVAVDREQDVKTYNSVLSAGLSFTF